jgi:hypothetical protein
LADAALTVRQNVRNMSAASVLVTVIFLNTVTPRGAGTLEIRRCF